MKRVLMLGVVLLAAMAVAQTNVSLPAGTTLKMKLDSTLATFSNKSGDPFSGRVTEAAWRQDGNPRGGDRAGTRDESQRAAPRFR